MIDHAIEPIYVTEHDGVAIVQTHLVWTIHVVGLLGVYWRVPCKLSDAFAASLLRCGIALFLKLGVAPLLLCILSMLVLCYF